MQPIKPRMIYFSLVLALLCQLLPWAGYGLIIRPEFVLLTLLYWLLRTPQLCNIGTGWIAGLLVDLATGSMFGQHALAYALTAFFAVSYQRRLALFNIWQQSAYVFALLLTTQLTLLIFKIFSGNELPGWHYFLPSISSILLWQAAIFYLTGIDGRYQKN